MTLTWLGQVGWLLSTQLDALVITHSHADYLDWGTLRPLFEAQGKPLCVLGPRSVWEALRGGGNPWGNELVLFQEGVQYTVGGVLLTVVFAAHSDPGSIGVVVQAEGCGCTTPGTPCTTGISPARTPWGRTPCCCPSTGRATI